MATYYEGLTRLDEVMHKYVGVPKDLLFKNLPLLKLFVTGGTVKRQRISYYDDYIHFKLKTNYAMNHRAVPETVRVPGASKGSTLDMTTTRHKIVGEAAVTYEQIMDAANGGGSYVTQLAEEIVKDLSMGAKANMEFALMQHKDALAHSDSNIGDTAATGIRAIVHSVSYSGGTGLSTITCKRQTRDSGNANFSSGCMGTKYLWPGLMICMDAKANLAAGTDATANYLEIQTVPDVDTFTVSGDVSGSVAENDLVVAGEYNSTDGRMNEYGKTITGLHQHLGNCTLSNYQGKSRSTYGIYLNPQISHYSGVCREISEELIGNLFDDLDNKLDTLGERDFLVITTSGVMREWAALFSSQVRFNGGRESVLGDINPRRVTMETLAFYEASFAPKGQIFVIKPLNYTYWYDGQLFDFEQWDNGKILGWIGTASDYDIKRARIRSTGQLVNFNPACALRTVDLFESGGE